MDDTRQSNGAKKTRQGNSNNTKFGTKPATHLGPVPKKTLNKYEPIFHFCTNHAFNSIWHCWHKDNPNFTNQLSLENCFLVCSNDTSAYANNSYHTAF